MALRRLIPLGLFFLGSVAAVGCGGATDTDFTSDDGSAGDSAGEGGNGGSSQGGSPQGGSSQGGASGSSSGGSSQGGSDPTGGSSTGGASTGGGSSTGGASGTSAGGVSTGGVSTGGVSTGGSGGTSSGGGSGGSIGGTGSGGAPTGGTGGLSSDCPGIIAQARAALAAAQVCDPTTDGPKCTGKVEDLCDCVVPVNDAASQQTQTYLGLREAAIECGVPCLAIVCPEPTTVTCGFGGVTTRIVARAQCTYSPR